MDPWMAAVDLLLFLLMIWVMSWVETLPPRWLVALVVVLVVLIGFIALYYLGIFGKG